MRPIARRLAVFGVLVVLTVAWALVFVKFERIYVQYDAYSWESVPEANNGGSNTFQVQTYNRPPFNMRGFIQFNVSGVPEGSVILYATMRLRMWSKSPDDPTKGFGDPTGRKYGAFPLLSSWDEYGINWSNQPQHDEQRFAVSGVPPGQPTGWSNQSVMWMDWDIRTIMMEWVNGRPNYGFVVMDLEENSPTLYATQFFTRNQVPGEDYFPRLELAYIPPSGITALILLAIVWLTGTIYLSKPSLFKRVRAK